MKLKNLDNRELFAFITLGGVCLNAGLMAAGIETMPGLWIKQVYEDHTLGASLGAITGVALGGVAGATVVAGKEMVKGAIAKIRKNSSNHVENDNKLGFN